MVALAVFSRPTDYLQWFTASKAGRALGRGVGGRIHAEALYSSRHMITLDPPLALAYAQPEESHASRQSVFRMPVAS